MGLGGLAASFTHTSGVSRLNDSMWDVGGYHPPVLLPSPLSNLITRHHSLPHCPILSPPRRYALGLVTDVGDVLDSLVSQCVFHRPPEVSSTVHMGVMCRQYKRVMLRRALGVLPTASSLSAFSTANHQR